MTNSSSEKITLCNFSDDTSPHAWDIHIDECKLMCLEHDFALPVCWFESS